MRIGGIVAALRHSLSFLWRLEARFKGVEFRGRALFQGRPIVSLAEGSQIIIEDGVVIASAVRANPLGLAQPTVLRALGAGARVVLRAGAGISGSVICAGATIDIGEQTLIGAGAMIIDNDFHTPAGEWGWVADPSSGARPIKIGRGVFIGARAIILKGVTIGDRAVVGAAAVVTKDVPAGQTAVGNPARVLEPKKPDG